MAGLFDMISSLFTGASDGYREELEAEARTEELQARIIERERQRVMLRRPRQDSSVSDALAGDIAAIGRDAARIHRNFWLAPPHRQYNFTRQGDRAIWHGGTPRGSEVARRFQSDWNDTPSAWLHKPPPLSLRKTMRLLVSNVGDVDDPKAWEVLLGELTEKESIGLRVAMDYVESKDGWKSDD